MKFKVLAVSLLALLTIGVSSASAYYYMTYGQAVAETKEYARHECAELEECIAWGKGPCIRRSRSGFNCIAAFFYPGPRYEEELECNQILHWGVRSGFVTLLSTGEVNCFYI